MFSPLPHSQPLETPQYLRITSHTCRIVDCQWYQSLMRLRSWNKWQKTWIYWANLNTFALAPKSNTVTYLPENVTEDRLPEKLHALVFRSILFFIMFSGTPISSAAIFLSSSLPYLRFDVSSEKKCSIVEVRSPYIFCTIYRVTPVYPAPYNESLCVGIKNV